VREMDTRERLEEMLNELANFVDDECTDDLFTETEYFEIWLLSDQISRTLRIVGD
jgi:hypothetical protein